MDLKRLRYFCAIVEHGQISKAAAALNMAQPPLSLRLKELEEEVGLKLIERSGHGCVVTEEGRRFYDKARLILSEVDALTEEMEATKGGKSHVVIGVSSTCASFLRAPLQNLGGVPSSIKLRVLLGDSTWLENMLRQRLIDFAIMQPPQDNKNLTIRALPVCRFVVLVPDSLVDPRWPDRLTLDHIGKLPLLLLRRSSGTGSYEHIIRSLHARGQVPNVLMDCPDVRVLRDLAESHVHAITILPKTELWSAIPEGIRSFALDEPDVLLHPALIHLDGQRLGCAARLMIDQIVTRAGDISN